MSYIGNALAHLENYRVLRVQEKAGEGHPDGLAGEHLLALGMRETALRNINGGAEYVNGKWVPAKTDRGWLQISDRYHMDWLRSVPGCKEGTWVSARGHSAGDEGYCPQFSTAIDFTLREMHEAMAYARKHGVVERDIVRFAIASHNGGIGGAMQGYQEGNVDKYTALGDYSGWVLAKVPEIRSWINAHPNWKYHKE